MTNKDYWQRRFERLEQREMDKADKAMADLKKVYEYTLRQLRDEVVEWYTRYADENGLSLADARKQLDARELKAFKLTLKEYEKLAKQQDLSDEYVKMLDQASIRARLSRSQMLYIKTANYVEQLAKQQEINLTELLKDVYEDSYYRTAYETQSMQGRYDAFSEVPKTSVEKAISRPWAEDGKDFSERIWDNKTKLLNTLQSEITRTLIAAEGTTLLAGRIANRFNVSFSNARRLAETETAYVQESARMDTWQKLHVAKYELIATLDSRTSPICRDMDGKVFDRADAKPGVTMPPFHCYCRTTTAPYIEGITDDADSTRAARDPDTGKTVQVPGKMSYADWKAVFVDKSKTLEEWEKSDTIISMKNEENQRYGRNKQTLINNTYIESGEYRKKFDTLTNNKEVNRVLYTKAKEMLKHRSGTLLEDMYWIDGDTGDIIASVLDETIEEGIRYRKSLIQKLQKYKNVIAMHTHPSSLPPSIADFNVMNQNGYSMGLVLCHNGNIFSYRAGEIVSNVLYNMYIAKFKKLGYTEYESQVGALREIAKNHDIDWNEVDSDD